MADKEYEVHAGVEGSAEDSGVCLADADLLCREKFSLEPETGIGELTPICLAEKLFNKLAAFLPVIAAILLMVVAVCITIDVAGRLLFNKPWVGITDLEILLVSVVGFISIAIPIVQRQSLQIDLFYDMFPEQVRRALYLFSCLVGAVVAAVLAYEATKAGLAWKRSTSGMPIPERPFVINTGICLALASMAFAFQIIHVLIRMAEKREFFGIAVAFALAALLVALPFLYKASGLRLSGLAIGGIGFLVLFVIMLLKVPLGFAMSSIGILGLLAIVRFPDAALKSVATIPFIQTANFVMIAFPMFMLMGDMVSLAGLSDDLFDAAKKWFGRVPGGLAIAAVGGCAGFGAICGDSLATVITMGSVAMPAMRSNSYDNSLSAGSIAAGGTLGILIPPSMGFIVYSMITEVSVGKLFVAGIVPGLLLAGIFMVIIFVQVLRKPSLAPAAPAYCLGEKLRALLYLIPVAVLFMVVVIGILDGWFTPAEGGALGAMLAFLYALVRRKLTVRSFMETMTRAAAMFGKLFALFVGLYVLGAFLATSRLPMMLAKTMAGLDISPYLVLLGIIILYVFLGCVMNITPMMMLTLPTIFPTVQALGFDGVWFGVVCVIVMEMGLITPPVGMNVFTLAGLQPDIPTATIFKGVLPFIAGMILCLTLVIVFPQIALCLL